MAILADFSAKVFKKQKDAAPRMETNHTGQRQKIIESVSINHIETVSLGQEKLDGLWQRITHILLRLERIVKTMTEPLRVKRFTTFSTYSPDSFAL